jgi:Domain of Unknown Function (DUF1206)
MASVSHVEAKTEQAVRGRWARRFARAGFVARGLIYGLIAALALAVAFGKRSRPEDQQGALRTIAAQPFGRLVLVALAVGFMAFAFWCLAQAVLGEKLETSRDVNVFKRLGLAALGLLYVGLCALCAGIVVGAGEPSQSGGGKGETRATRFALEQPAGRYLVIGVGIAIVVAGIVLVGLGLTRKFRDELKERQMGGTERRWFMALGVAGYVARGIVFALAGFFVARAAWQYDPKEAVGLDGALAKLVHADYGPFLLALVAAGLLAYAMFSLVEARYREV